MKKNRLVLSAIFVAFSSLVHGMDRAPDQSSIETECIRSAYEYLEEGLELIKRDILVNENSKLVKFLIGNQTIICTMRNNGAHEAFSWAMKSSHDKEEWTVVKFYSSAASKMISDLIPDLGKLESPGFDAVCRQLPTFPPSPVWVVAYSLSSFDYGISWHIVDHKGDDRFNYTSSQASNHHFFKSDELKINAFDFFILNVACILGIKNGDDSLIQKCEAHENIRKYIKHISDSRTKMQWF